MRICSCAATAAVLTFFGAGLVLGQGSLTPPGAPGPTMKTLDQLEPRTPIAALPFTVSSRGSYYLTGNLTCTGGTDGITINASDVTLDLAGFCVAGAGLGSNGIVVTGIRSNVCIRGGSVKEWLDDGIDATNAGSCRILDVRATFNQGRGIAGGERTTLSGCVAAGNAGAGISAAIHSLLGECTATHNGGNGIEAGGGATVRGCVALVNGGKGIEAGDVSTVSDCTSRDNSGQGFALGAGCTVKGCAATANADGIECGEAGTIVASSARSNGRGIAVGQGSTVKDCSALSNGGRGIEANVNCTVIGCAATANGDDGIAAGVGSVVRDCTARGNNGTGVEAGTGCRVVGCTPHYNTGAGIAVPNNCYVADNISYDNDQDGIAVSMDHNRIEGNNVVENDGWGIQVTGTGNLVIRNSAGGNGSGAYSCGETNAVGPILDFSAGGEITNSNPWANFSL